AGARRRPADRLASVRRQRTRSSHLRDHRWLARTGGSGRQRDPRAARHPDRSHDRAAGGVTIDTFLRDLRFALRGLLRTPGFTLAAILALSLGIGATTAIFSVVHAVLLRSLGWGEESRLVSVRGNFEAQNLKDIWVSPPEYRDLQASPLFETVGVYYVDSAALQGERAERVKSTYATGSFFTALGVAPVQGRVFTPDEDRRGNDGVTLISWNAWQKRFGGD